MTIVESETSVSAELVAVAAECVVAAQHATPAMVQRKLRTTWAESLTILATLERLAVIGPARDDDSHAVLVAPDGLAEMLARIRHQEPGPLPTPPPAESPAEPPGVELVKRAPNSVVDHQVYDGELIADQDVPGDQRPHLIGRIRQTPTAVEARRHVVRLVKSDPATRTVQIVRCGTKVVYVVGQGGVSWCKRAQAAATHGQLREQIRIARIVGDNPRVTDLTKQLDEARTNRQKRLLALPSETVAVLATGGVLVLAGLTLLLVAGVLAWAMPGGVDWSTWWSGVGSAWALAVDLVKLVFGLVTWLAVPLAVLAAWREGQRAAQIPAWLLTSLERKLACAEITPSKVVLALRNLGVAELRKALKEAEDAGAGLLGPIAVAGCGVEVDVLLPSGVSTDQVQDRRRRLAENLDRHEHELHIVVAAARTVRLWIANPGALDEPVGPSPLVVDETIKADLYTGRAPWGDDLRGTPITLSLLQRHVLIAGISNQGKTATIRALALWLALDVTCEFRIADLKGIGDWHMFDSLATTLIEGPTDSHVVGATEMLEDGVAEMERRLGALDKERYPNGVTRELARKPGSGFHPIFLIVDEEQVAFMSPVIGPDKRPYGGTKKNSRFFNAARYLLNQGRAVNVILWQGTQNPTDQNLPALVREAAHLRVSLAVGKPEQSRMALGDAAVDKGAAPHELRAGIDKGVVVVAGDGAPLEPGQASITIRTHFIDGPDATVVARRAIERRRKAGRIARQIETGVQVVDHLADILAAMRDERRVRTVVVLGRLIEDNAAVYEPWGHGDLAKAVDEYAHLGLGIQKYGGDSVLRIEEVQAAAALRQ